MSGRRGGLGRGISSLIPTRADRIEREREAADAQADAQPTDAQPTGSGTDSTAPARAGRRPVDVFFAGADAEADDARPSRSAARAAREMAAAHRDPEGRFRRSTRRVRPAEAAAPTQDAVAGQASTTPAVGRRSGAARPAASGAAGERMTAVAEAGADVAAAQSELAEVPGLTLVELDPAEIVPNPVQPRHEFDQAALDELTHSVREFGVLQPIVVRRHEAGGYELIMGERRLRAAKAARLDRIPALIRDTADEDMLRDALLENLHRANLNPLEEASAYQQLMQDFGITQEQLAERIGRSRPQVANTLRLLKLPEGVQRKVAAGVLTAGHARALLAVAKTHDLDRLADRVVREGLSVRETERLAAQPQRQRHAQARAGRVQEQLHEVEERIEERLDTSVRVRLSKRKGSITIDFATVADLNRIVGLMGVKGFGEH